MSPVTEEAARTKRHWLVLLLVVVLPFSIVPRELIASGPSLAPVQFGLCVLLFLRYRLWRGRLNAVDGAVVLFAAWTLIRCVAPSEMTSTGDAVAASLRDCEALLAGLILYRLARLEDTRPAVIRALRYGLVLLLLFEAYQLAAGLPRLVALGYGPPQFNFFTENGTYRPFGTFPGPTVFGGYLAMLGSAVIWTAASRRWAAIAAAVTVAGLYVTETRAAWLAFAIANAVVLLVWGSREMRAKVLGWSIFAVPALAFVVIGWPGLFTSFWSRLTSLESASFTSNSVRLSLWRGTIQATGVHPVIGYGKAPFPWVLTPYTGPEIAAFAHPHDNYLLVVWSLGLVGLSLFLWLLWGLFSHLEARNRTGRAALAGLLVFVLDGLVETTWTNFAFTSTVFLLAGLGAVPFRSDAKVDPNGGRGDTGGDGGGREGSRDAGLRPAGHGGTRVAVTGHSGRSADEGSQAGRPPLGDGG